MADNDDLYQPSPLRTLLVLLSVSSMYVALTPPIPRATTEEKARYRKPGPRDLSTIPITPVALALKPLLLGVGLWELLRNVDAWHTDRWGAIGYGCFEAPADFMLGTFLVLVGAYIRVVCYRALGAHFTFDLSLQEHHRLITDGPYAVVRHPSYTGFLLIAMGAMLTQLGPSSYWIQTGMWATSSGRIIGFIYITIVVLSCVITFARIGKEDMMLQETFKNEWDDWAKRVPYKLVPYVY